MRKITIESTKAFEENRNFKKANTEVVTDRHTTFLKLHGNTIAIKNIETDEVKISNCGWLTTTTKERLNGLEGVKIMQKDFVWYLNGKEWSGKLITV